MLLVIDIGNTNIKLGVFDSSQSIALFTFAVSSSPRRTPDEYAWLIKSILRDNSLDRIDAVVISSVVPSLCKALSDAAVRICGYEPFIIGSGTHTGFPIKIDIQAQLGADIVSNAAAAFSVCEPPFVIVDVGTATTLCAVDAGGRLIGTAISPGAAISLDALNTSCALLSDVGFECPQEIIGKNTKDSIQSGAFYGHVFMIDGFVRNLREKLCSNGEKLSLIGTGGLGNAILPHCRNKFMIVPDLTLQGAATLFYYNRKNGSNYTKS